MKSRALIANRGELPDDALAELAVRGTADERDEAFEELYLRHVNRVFGYCFRLLGSRHQAEDATSDVFLAVVQGLRKYRPMAGKSFRSWLFSIAHHTIADHRGRGIRDARRTTSLDLNLHDSAPSPSDLAIAADEGRWIRAALGILPARERDVVELDLAGLSTREVGEVLRLKDGAVYTARSRALEKLRVHLAESAASMEAPHAIRPIPK